MLRPQSPSGGSTLTTSAPFSANSMPQCGPATPCERSTTRRPSYASDSSNSSWLMRTTLSDPERARLASMLSPHLARTIRELHATLTPALSLAEGEGVLAIPSPPEGGEGQGEGACST